ncbi:MAG TPA: RAMP superfamily CRISPR-associated protein [Syntrophorhabdaceae bacterium]|nr:RAMP superfamily CRISPR-associated protein [Syntrophorhabdaceae bacterium]
MAKTYTLKISFLSRAVIASAEGYGAVVDTDIMFDDLGIPYIPARRIKGCLRDSAIEVLDMLSQAGIGDLINLGFQNSKDDKFRYDIVNELFGVPGMDTVSSISFTNLYIKDYGSVRQWLEYLMESKDSRAFISRDAVTSYYTELTQQTAIDESTGTAKKHSLRTTRCVKSGVEFYGEIKVACESSDYETLLCLSAMNFRFIGSMRTRGFGRVECSIGGVNCDLILQKLEGLCIS